MAGNKVRLGPLFRRTFEVQAGNSPLQGQNKPPVLTGGYDCASDEPKSVLAGIRTSNDYLYFVCILKKLFHCQDHGLQRLDKFFPFLWRESVYRSAYKRIIDFFYFLEKIISVLRQRNMDLSLIRQVGFSLQKSSFYKGRCGPAGLFRGDSQLCCKFTHGQNLCTGCNNQRFPLGFVRLY